MYIALGVITWASFIFWARPGPLMFVEKMYQFGRINGIIWLFLLPINIVIFIINFNLNFWSLVNIAFVVIALLYLGNQFFLRKNYDLINIVLNGGFRLLSATIAISLNLLIIGVQQFL